MSTDTGAPREFIPVEDPLEVMAYFVEASQTTASTLVWTKNQENITQSRISMISETDRSFYAWVPQDFELLRFQDELKEKQTSDCFFSVSLSQANIFFKTTFLEYDSAGLKFKIPDKVYKVQRRKNVRCQIPDDYSMPAEFQDPLYPQKTLKKKVLDISAGGISFITHEKDDPLFQVGMILNSFKFSIRLRLIRVTAEVRHKKALPNQSIKVGLMFTEISAADVEHISAYVFDENRKYFASFL
jgi:hypothetical protein